MYIKLRNVFILVFIVGLLAISSTQAIDYQDYKYSRKQAVYFEITYNKDNVIIQGYDNDVEHILTVPRNDLKAKEGLIYVGDEIIFDNEKLILDKIYFYYNQISDTRILDDEDNIIISFLTGKKDTTRVEKIKQGNIVNKDKTLKVEHNEFIRGVVISITGDVEIYGEVNKDIIALFGDVYVAPDAVARGDIASIKGRIDVAKDASVYGEIYYLDKKGTKRKHRFHRDDENLTVSGDIKYNRVDGLSLFGGVQFQDVDSLLPTIYGKIGYGFASERWRYDFGAEQIIKRYPMISVGGSLYRQLMSDDDWLLDDGENTIFVVLAAEDYKDYYEAEGGSIFLKVKPVSNVTFETRYRSEETKWLNEHDHLWTLFGGDKLFRRNFSTVEESFRLHGIGEIDSTTNAYWYNKISWDTRVEDEPFDHSAWYATADLEWSHDNFNSDFDYRRYTVAVRRYQKVNKNAIVLLRGVFGGSDGYLPMYKRFYLGGLGTLYGYNHKEFMGTRFWMLNSEYRIDFPKIETAVSLLWDVAQIANDQKLNSDIDIKHNVGAALYFGNKFRLSLAKRLDRSYNDDPKFYVRFDHVF